MLALCSENLNGSAFVGANFQGLTTGPGFFLHISSANSTFDTASSVNTIGSVPADSQLPRGVLPFKLKPGTWHRLGLRIHSGVANGSIDGIALFDNVRTSTARGWGVMGTGGYDLVQFDNLYLNASYSSPPGPAPPGPPPPPPSPPPPPPSPPKTCKVPAVGHKVVLWTCDPSRTATQSWIVPNGTASSAIALRGSPHLCIGHSLQLTECSAAPAFVRREPTGDSAHLLLASDRSKCLDVAPHRQPDTSYPLDTWACNNNFDGGANEVFLIQGGHSSYPEFGIVSNLWNAQLCISSCEAGS